MDCQTPSRTGDGSKLYHQRLCPASRILAAPSAGYPHPVITNTFHQRRITVHPTVNHQIGAPLKGFAHLPAANLRNQSRVRQRLSAQSPLRRTVSAAITAIPPTVPACGIFVNISIGDKSAAAWQQRSSPCRMHRRHGSQRRITTLRPRSWSPDGSRSSHPLPHAAPCDCANGRVRVADHRTLRLFLESYPATPADLVILAQYSLKARPDSRHSRSGKTTPA